MVTSLSSFKQPESLETWPKSGEHSRTSQDSSRIHSVIPIGKSNHSSYKTESDSFGCFSFGIFTNLSCFGSWLKTVRIEWLLNIWIEKERMIEHWRYRLGETNKTHGAAHRDRRFPADRKKNYVRYSNFHQVRRNKRLNMIWTNWWCRDQNFRKYFEMRKRHGIRPSLSGF